MPTKLPPSVARMSEARRIQLVQDVWDSIEEKKSPPELSEELIEELERRWRAYKRNPASAVPWEVAKARILKRLRSSR